MNTTSNKLIAIVSIVAVSLAAATASAKDKGNGNGGNNGGGNSNRSLSLGGNNSLKNINIGSVANLSNSNNSNKNSNSNGNKKGSIAIGIGIGLANSALNNSKNKPCHDNHCYNTTYMHTIYVPVYTCFRPLHCFAWVLPGDTWATISLREYNNPNFFPAIAAFNGLSLSVPLVVGQQIGLPEIHPNGVLKVSFAPAPAPFVLPAQVAAPIATPALPIGASQNLTNTNVIGGTQAPQVLPNANAMGVTNLGSPSAAAKLPSFAVGSVIALDGQALGNVAGNARLKFAGVALKAEVVEWSATSVKIQLPVVDLTGAISGELEVLRADGSLAIKTTVELTPAANKLALGN